MGCLFAGAACSFHLIPSGLKYFTPSEHCLILAVLLCHFFEAHQKKTAHYPVSSVSRLPSPLLLLPLQSNSPPPPLVTAHVSCFFFGSTSEATRKSGEEVKHFFWR